MNRSMQGAKTYVKLHLSKSISKIFFKYFVYVILQSQSISIQNLSVPFRNKKKSTRSQSLKKTFLQNI